jgi:hypothetical protein
MIDGQSERRRDMSDEPAPDEIISLNQGALDADQLSPDELEEVSGGDAGSADGSIIDPLGGSCVCNGVYLHPLDVIGKS